MATQLKSEAMLGYVNAGATCPFLATSNCASAWHIGAWLQRTHRTEPRDVRPSRGDTFHVNNMKVRLNYIQGCVEIERIA